VDYFSGIFFKYKMSLDFVKKEERWWNIKTLWVLRHKFLNILDK
jgi:hypothetical protein